MKKFIIFIFFIFSCLCFTVPSFQASAYQLETGNAFVISSKCFVYKEPSFASEKITVDGQDFFLTHGQEVEIMAIQNDFAQIKIESIEGYVYKFYLTQSSAQSVYPVFNASLRKDATIYDLDKNPTEYTVKRGSRVYLYNGFKDKEKYTAVQVVLEDGSLYNGYILTSCIKPDGISPLLIVGISIIIASVTIILSLIFIKKKRKNKK